MIDETTVINSATIGVIRKAIAYAKKEIRNMTDDEHKNKTNMHLSNINNLVNIINKRDNINKNDILTINEIYEAIKDVNNNELGMCLIDILETVEF